MTKQVEKKFPRSEIIDRQRERVRQILELDESAQDSVRGGNARYAPPPPPPPGDELLKQP